MDAIEIKHQILSLVHPDLPNEWEVEEHAQRLAQLSEADQKAILKQIPVIWPVSYALCFTFLEQAADALQCLHPSQLPQWVNAILDAYETGGLYQARIFMAEVENNFLCRIRGEAGLTFEEVVHRLTPYLHALAGRHLELSASLLTYTDTTTVFLPHEIGIFKDKEKNFLLYKLAASFQWGFIACGTYYLEPALDSQIIIQLRDRYQKPLNEKNAWLDTFFALFPDSNLAADLFHIAECTRITAWLDDELPGLMRDCRPIRERLHKLRPDCTTLSGKSLFAEGLK